MIAAGSLNRFTLGMSLIVALVVFAPTRANAQSGPTKWHGLAFGGYAMFGQLTFTASQSFDTIVGRKSGPIFGGGVRVGLPLGGLFVDAGASRLQATGERVFVATDRIYKLGIPVDVTVSPVELSAGWNLHIRRIPRLSAYAAVGLTLLNYRESSALATTGEDTDSTFHGYHLFGGLAYKFNEYLGLAGETVWSTVPDAIGESGASKAFNETDLGGTAIRLKLTIGR